MMSGEGPLCVERVWTMAWPMPRFEPVITAMRGMVVVDMISLGFVGWSRDTNKGR